MAASDDEVPDERGREPRVDPRLLRPDPGETLEQFKARLLAEVLELREREGVKDGDEDGTDDEARGEGESA